MSALLCSTVFLHRRIFWSCFPIRTYMHQKYASELHERGKELNYSQRLVSRKLLSSSVILNQNSVRNFQCHQCIRNSGSRFNILLAHPHRINTAYDYSTKVKESPYASVKIEKYLLHFKNKYLRAVEGKDYSDELAWKLHPLVDLIDKRESLKSNIEELEELVKDPSSDKELQQLASSDLEEVKSKLQSLEEDVLTPMLLEEPPEPTAVVLEVTAGVGGEEAQLFCKEIFEMYEGLANFMGWEFNITNASEKRTICHSAESGFRHASANISGDDAYKLLKYEGGIHRVQRIPKTEKSGRIHTSTISVAVMAQPSEIHIEIASDDLIITTNRSSGAGGQHVNTTNSAVRIVHIPSGIAFQSSSDRSQHVNKRDCMDRLRAYLYQKQLDENTSKYSSSRKIQVGTRGRSEKIRTYNYSQDRITDHRIGVSVRNIAGILHGGKDLLTLISSVKKEAKNEILWEKINEFYENLSEKE